MKPPFSRAFLLFNAWLCSAVYVAMILDEMLSARPQELPPIYPPLFFVGALCLFTLAWVVKVLSAKGLTDGD